MQALVSIFSNAYPGLLFLLNFINIDTIGDPILLLHMVSYS